MSAGPDHIRYEMIGNLSKPDKLSSETYNLLDVMYERSQNEFQLYMKTQKQVTIPIYFHPHKPLS